MTLKVEYFSKTEEIYIKYFPSWPNNQNDSNDSNNPNGPNGPNNKMKKFMLSNVVYRLTAYKTGT